ncbi:MAG TPA: GNAT family protein [Gaiellaceae bacterium]|nr:GNAT family protein [Gaiellaceae bacterium]
MAELRGERVLLRPLRAADVPQIAEIQAQPTVASRWGEPEQEKLQGKAAGTDECTAFAIELDGEVVGLIQYHEEDDPMYRHAGIDLFLSEQVHGQGLGADAVRTMALHLVRDRAHHRLVIDPAADNTAAIRAYEKAGFRPVGVMRQYERLPGGEWHDGLLMDLLADEL